jgi:hypothetical protein
MTEFYVCDEEWERHEQITREDVFDEDMSEDVYLMEETPLSDFIEDEGQHFEFVFDPYAERSFFLDVKELIPGEHLSAPEVIRAKGDAPQQLLDFEDPFVEKITKAIKEVGVAGGYLYIFDTSSGIPYISETLSTDVTGAVKAKLGIQ